MSFLLAKFSRHIRPGHWKLTHSIMPPFDTDIHQSFDIHTTPSPSPFPSPSPTSLNPTWESRYEELLQWRAGNGDTCVPKAEGALGRWVARQRELKRTGKLDPSREEALNAISFVWNTVTAMWEERFRRLGEWKRIHGHCAVPIAQGELGTWVSKQRQLRKRRKLSKEKIDALDSLNFIWSTAEADWEDKFKRLCEWARERGHASVPFNEGELGWWVNTQRQSKRKGKLSPSREVRLQSLGFVWNPSSSRSRTSNATSTNVINFMSSVDTTPSLTPKKSENMETHEEANTIIQLFTGDGATQMPETKQEPDMLQDNPSPVSAVAEQLPSQVTLPSQSEEHLISPPPTFLSHNLWSPTVLPSPLLSSGLNYLSMPKSIHEPAGGTQLPIFELTSQGHHTDILDHIFPRDDGCVLEQANVDSLTCYEEL